MTRKTSPPPDGQPASALHRLHRAIAQRFHRLKPRGKKTMSWEKFGSPYDPNHSGKMQMPKKGQRAEHPLRGCGDPRCPMCNPETAAVASVTPPPNATISISRGSFISFDESMMREAMDSAFRRVRAPEISSEIIWETIAQEPTPAAPPASYQAARKAVDKWLIKAPEQAFDDIVGNDEALEQLRDAIQAPVVHKALYEAYGMKMPKGALLSGPPGCGKTMFARAAASEMRRLHGDQVEFLSISGSELQSPYVGVTEGYIKAIFAFAREYRDHHGHPLLVFMDEADALLPDRTGRVRRVASWEESQVATFLAEMDGIRESGAFVLLASNRPEVIDQAVLRDGRCDFKITVRRPTIEAIEVILRKNFVGVLTGETDVEKLVFAAVEALFDPHKILAEGHLIKIQLADGTDVSVTDRGKRHFLLEHILSGAMAASIPARAIRRAFARDKAAGEAKGVTVDDVLGAVNDLFQENKGLDHSFAMNEFKAEILREEKAGSADGV